MLVNNPEWAQIEIGSSPFDLSFLVLGPIMEAIPTGTSFILVLIIEKPASTIEIQIEVLIAEPLGYEEQQEKNCQEEQVEKGPTYDKKAGVCKDVNVDFIPDTDTIAENEGEEKNKEKDQIESLPETNDE